MEWETWFKEAEPVQPKLQAFEAELNSEETLLQNAIGEQFTDIISLSNRLDSLKSLAAQQEKHIVDTSANSNARLPALPGKTKPQNDVRISTWLAFFADRNISLQKYSIASQSLFLADSLEISSPELEVQRKRLWDSLNNWLVNGTMISQTIYTALLVQLKCTPAQLCTTFLETRLTKVKELLKDAKSSSDLFKLVDSTSFVYNQIHNDLGQSRLLNRNLVDTPQFSGSTGFNMVIKPKSSVAGQIKAYPEACYAPSIFVPNELPDFIAQVANEVHRVSKHALNAVKDVKMLVSTITTIVQQAQDVLNAETGTLDILSAFEPAYSQQFLRLISEVPAEKWNTEYPLIRQELDHTSRLARATKNSVPKFSMKLDELVSEAETQLTSKISDAYALHRKKVLESSQETLHDLGSVLTKLSSLDKSFTELGGEPEAIQESLYKKFSELLCKHYDEKKKAASFGDNKCVRAFEIQCLIDHELPEFAWDSRGLSIIRENVFGEPFEAEEMSLLLRPLVI